MKTMIRSFLTVAISLVLTSPVHATVFESPPGTVTLIGAYTEFGGGDVIFYISTPVSGCHGFWLRPADPGFKTVYAALLASYVTKLPVSVTAYNDQLWSGSSGPYCRVYNLKPA